jgi:hypothetical protein
VAAAGGDGRRGSGGGLAWAAAAHLGDILTLNGAARCSALPVTTRHWATLVAWRRRYGTQALPVPTVTRELRRLTRGGGGKLATMRYCSERLILFIPCVRALAPNGWRRGVHFARCVCVRFDETLV